MDQSMFGKIKLIALDFDGVLSTNSVLVDQDGREAVMCSREDGFGIDFLQRNTDVKVIVISREANPVVRKRCEKLKVPCTQEVMDKLEILKKEVKNYGVSMEETCFIGNDISDNDCISAAGIGVAVHDAHKKTKEVAEYVTEKNGGQGAVREIIDIILEQKNVI